MLRRSPLRPFVACLAALALGVAACGGSSAEDDLAADLGERLSTDPTLADYDVSATEGRCTADALIADFGVEQLEPLVVTGDDPRSLRYDELDDGDIARVATALATCIDASEGDSVAGVLSEAVANGVIESATPEFPMSDAEATCIGDVVVDEMGVTTLFALGIASASGDPAAGDPAADDVQVELEAEQSDAFVAAFLACTDVRARVLAGVAEGEIDQAVLDCLDANITDEQVTELFALGFDDDADSETRTAEVLAPALAACT